MDDPTLLVRLDVAWASALAGEKTPKHYQELLEYLNFHEDQPVGAIKKGQLALAEKKFPEAIHWIKKAIAWDPGSAYQRYLMGRALYATGSLGGGRGFDSRGFSFRTGEF